MASETTFRAAVPYAIGTLALGTAGAVTAVAATSVALQIVGIAMGIIGAYGFFATLICGIVHSGEPDRFREDLPKYAATMIGSAVADIISAVVREVIANLVNRGLGNNTSSVRISHL